MTNAENYSVFVEPFAERHYIKSFERKHHRAWEITLRALIAQFERVDALCQKDIAEIITDQYPFKVVKSNFSVAGSGKSPKGSGNRCIAVVDEKHRRVSIVLVYHKTDLGSGNETARWKSIIKENYSEYKGLL